MASPTSTSQQQGLPSISSLTNGLPPSTSAQQHQSHGDHSQGEHLRDSGTWPQPHSKRECFLLFFKCLKKPGFALSTVAFRGVSLPALFSLPSKSSHWCRVSSINATPHETCKLKGLFWTSMVEVGNSLVVHAQYQYFSWLPLECILTDVLLQTTH